VDDGIPRAPRIGRHHRNADVLRLECHVWAALIPTGEEQNIRGAEHFDDIVHASQQRDRVPKPAPFDCVAHL
jgi:hypothetical protein